MPKKYDDLAGKRFGRIRVTRRAGTYTSLKSPSHRPLWECVCDCGKSKIVLGQSLKNGSTQSCGCLQKESGITHGMTKSPEYQAWRGAKERCTNKNNAQYYNCGGRGITMCDRWLTSFENFFADMDLRPSSQHSLDRKDNNGNYCGENCRWATKKEQIHNRRPFKMTHIEHFTDEELMAEVWRRTPEYGIGVAC